MQNGDFVTLYLLDPLERVWGRLLRLSDAGVSLRGIDVKEIETFKYQFHKQEQVVFPQTSFYPMRRVLKMDLDEPIGTVPSIVQSIRAFAGAGEIIAESDPDGPAGA